MPLVKHIHINETCQLAIWKITEDLSVLQNAVCLNESDKDRCDSFGSIARKKEYLATRILVRTLLGEGIVIKNNADGKPYLINSDLDISISHSKDYVGIMVGKGHDLALDIEYLSERVFKITKRFMSEDEMSHLSEINKQVHIYQHWCAKECLIKLYGKKDVLLIDELKIHPFLPDQVKFSGEVIRPDFSKKFNFQYETFDSYLMVWCCQKRD
ncbi:phosphopantetheinyl transferase [Ancylomarina subtilis]|uniref:Phosphopantetheinyl transferase n=1 Tax=Ancylomarina subtilis TaxID=1639035 RepID=A0A4Q7VLL4_9BACT|nr:4'-phosphopantetheinyl transferase superfamily protein [Ancylomarina subtilis]RZT97007.1 phosphopantetheinyl transferase [Ancylomarina subtilis]